MGKRKIGRHDPGEGNLDSWMGEIHYDKWRNLKSKYGLTEEAYLDLLKGQDYVCKICKTEPPAPKNRYGKSRRTLFVDHDHKTDMVRGLLCQSCNSLVGFADDNPVILLRAIQYLKGKL